MADDSVVINTGQGMRPGHKLGGVLGKLFGELTNAAVTLPGGQQQYSDDPSQLAQTASRSLPSADAMLGPDVLNPDVGFQRPGAPQMPSQIQTPTFEQANQSGGLPGAGGATNPALTTKGKILSTILQIAKGGLAGYAASQQGDPRNGYPNANAGAGFAAAEQLPFIQAFRQQKQQKDLLENYLTKAELDNLPFQRAAALAKLRKDQADAKRAAFQTTKNGVYNTDTQQYEPNSQPPEKPDNLDQMISSRLQDVLRAGSDPKGDQQLQQMIQTKQSLATKQEKPDTPEQQFLDEFNRKNPGSTVAAAEQAYFRMQHPEQGQAHNDARADRSYQFHAQRIDKLRTPVEDGMSRIAKLEDTLNQNSPQADALVAPELLTAMAGGQGSGLRMNEAEISRIVGGRTNFESLKAALNKWQTDPSKGLSITPPQRDQIRRLIQTRKVRLSQMQSAIDEESSNLAASDDPAEHRKIYNRLQKRLSDVNTGGGQNSAGTTTAQPQPIKINRDANGRITSIQ